MVGESYADDIKGYIFAEFLPGVTSGQLADDYDLVANGVIDSLGLLRVVSWLENRFDIPMDEVDISEQDFVSVDAICAFVERTVGLGGVGVGIGSYGGGTNDRA
jgi:acyl carrier protein